jgi:hypothetical protein
MGSQRPAGQGPRSWVSTPGRAALVAVIATLVLAVLPCAIAAFLAGAILASSHDGHGHGGGWDKPRYGPYDDGGNPGPRIEKQPPAPPAPKASHLPKSPAPTH